MRVKNNKRPETVGRMWQKGCDKHGWPRRARWDKGREGKVAIYLQLRRWRDKRNREGTVITGRSVHNTRIEGMWRVMSPVVHYWRNFFMAQMCKERVWGADTGVRGQRRRVLCDTANKLHLFALQTVTMPLIQRDMDQWSRAWDCHSIRGPRTVDGRGGGVPNTLFNHPVSARTLVRIPLCSNFPQLNKIQQ